jgi:cadmium resistance transport/sequestration family protein
MDWFFSALITGFTSFLATNIDDIVLLMMFFAQVNHHFRPHHIVAGQYLGFGAIILASLPGFLGGLVISKPWIGLLGLLPIAIGIKQLHPGDESFDESITVQTVSELPTLPSVGKGLFHPKTYQVAVVTFANGGDNIGIYVPLFASSSLLQLAVILGVFFMLIAVWCAAAYLLARQPAIAQILSRYAHRLVPFLLIGLGLYILIENGSYRLLPPLSEA